MRIRMLTKEELRDKGYEVVEEYRSCWYDIGRCQDYGFHESWFGKVHKVTGETPSDFYIDYEAAIPKEFCEVIPDEN